MKLMPQCLGGILPPFITSHGQVLPCCMTHITPKTKNIYGEDVINYLSINPKFNVKNKQYLQIIESVEWKDMMSKLNQYKFHFCQKWCANTDLNKFVPFAPDENGYTFNGHRTDILQLELTNICSLKCEYCERTRYPFRLNRDNMPLEIAWSILTEKYWDRYIDCAKYGDPIWYEHMIELLKLMIKTPTMKQYSISLAATGRKKEYWEEVINLWGKLNERGVLINPIFGIDGLEETSKIYRKNQNWNEIVYALQYTAKNTNIVPTLQFIPFKWNEHEIDHMSLLAEKWGANFWLCKSARFTENDVNRPDEDLYIKY